MRALRDLIDRSDERAVGLDALADVTEGLGPGGAALAARYRAGAVVHRRMADQLADTLVWLAGEEVGTWQRR